MTDCPVDILHCRTETSNSNNLSAAALEPVPGLESHLFDHFQPMNHIPGLHHPLQSAGNLQKTEVEKMTEPKHIF